MTAEDEAASSLRLSLTDTNSQTCLSPELPYQQPLVAEPDHRDRHQTSRATLKSLSPADIDLQAVPTLTEAAISKSLGWTPSDEELETPTDNTSQTFEDYGLDTSATAFAEASRSDYAGETISEAVASMSTGAFPDWMARYFGPTAQASTDAMEGPGNDTSQAFEDYGSDTSATAFAEAPRSDYAGETISEAVASMSAGTFPDWMTKYFGPTAQASTDAMKGPGAPPLLDDRDRNNVFESQGTILTALSSVPTLQDDSDAQSFTTDTPYIAFQYHASSQNEAVIDQNNKFFGTLSSAVVAAPIKPPPTMNIANLDNQAGSSTSTIPPLPPLQPTKRKRAITYVFKDAQVGAKKPKGDKHNSDYDHDDNDPIMFYYNYQKASSN